MGHLALPRHAANRPQFQGSAGDLEMPPWRVRVLPGRLSKKRPLLAFALVGGLVLFLGCMSAPTTMPPQPPPSTTAIRVGWWNILHENRDLALIAEHIGNDPPDVIALAEVMPDAHRALTTSLQDHYPFIIAHDEFAVFSTIPLVDVRKGEGAPGHKPFLVVGLALDDVVDLAVVHLVAPHPNAPTPAAVMRMLDDIEDVHAREMRRVLHSVDDKRPRIVVGDFNSLPFDDTRSMMQSHGFVDVATELSSRPSSTWRGEIFGIDVPLRIDYVFVDDAVRATALSVTTSPASDHAFMVASLRVRFRPQR